jgi:hypothetical protein
MADSLHRREFIKTVSLLGASILIENPVSAKTLLSGNDRGEMKNDYFTVAFDSERGRITIHRSNGTPFLTGGTSCANSTIGKRSIASDMYKHTLDSTTFKDQLGSGKRLLVYSHDLENKLDCELHISIYDHLEIITFEVFCKNVSSRDIVIRSLEPIRVIKNEGGKLNVPGVSRCITNGAMYYNTGMIHEFGTENPNPSDDIKGVKLSNNSISSPNETVRSWWNAGLFAGYDKESVVLGYAENNSCLGQVLISKPGPNQVSFLAESVFTPALILQPGKTITSNSFMINIAGSPYTALEQYAGAVGTVQGARTRSIVNGWCSWFYTLAEVTEDEVLFNADFASKHLQQFGLEYIQIDEGYQRWHGDWEGNKRFPHGMKWLAEQIKGYGFKPGLWIAPYVISEPTELFQQHQDWLLTNPDGTLQRIGNWPDENSDAARNENPKRYCLDITHPEAAKWMYDLFDTIANRWGYEMIKIDFMAWSILAANHYYDSSVSSALVYRRGLEIMRRAAGNTCHILECGPGATTVGLIDSMRIEADINYGFSDAAWKTYFLDPACSASAAARRYYFHKKTWINDVDHLCMHLLTHQQSEAAATLIALSGGTMISGDRLTQLDAYKLEILKKITPSFGEAAVPVDLFDTDMQSVFALKVKKRFGEWTIAGFFNASVTEPVEKKFSLRRLWLEPGKTCLAFDFWKQQFVGEVTDEIKVVVQPGSVTLFALHEKLDRPQFISTDRHVLQGAVELESVSWNESAKTLSGISVGPLNTSHNVSVYVPGNHPWTWGGYVLFRDYDSYSLKLVDKNIIQVHIDFEKGTRVQWHIAYDEFFEQR